MKSAGCRISEIKETRRSLMSLGEGRVNRKAMTAFAATTYVSIIHCNAISLFGGGFGLPLVPKRVAIANPGFFFEFFLNFFLK
jgi:hypothetical protein